MANYEFTVISNQFKTKNNEEVRKVFEDLGFEETYINSHDHLFIGSYSGASYNDDMVVVKEKATGKVIGAYDTCYSEYDSLYDFLTSALELSDVNEENYTEVSITEYMQDMLEDKEVFILREVWNEKLRYSIGCATIIGKDFVDFIDLDTKIREIVEARGLSL